MFDAYKTALARLEKARQDVKDAENEARNKSGRKIHAMSDAATCFCITGAIERVTKISDFADATCARDTLRKVVGYYGIATWNDTPGRTQSEVLDAMDKAIKIMEGDHT